MARVTSLEQPVQRPVRTQLSRAGNRSHCKQQIRHTSTNQPNAKQHPTRHSVSSYRCTEFGQSAYACRCRLLCRQPTAIMLGVASESALRELEKSISPEVSKSSIRSLQVRVWLLGSCGDSCPGMVLLLVVVFYTQATAGSHTR